MKSYGIRRKLFAGMVAGIAMLASQAAWSEQYAANFKGTDIQEFINIVGKNLNKTIIVDPTVRGKINVRSYDLLDDEQYYQFFLNVLQVYGYAVVEMENRVIKVIKDKDAKTAAIRVADDNTPGLGDEMVTRIVALYNTEAKQLAPLLRQLNDNAGGGNVVNYDPSNVLMISGRAAVVNKLVEIVRRVDKQGDTAVEVVSLEYASAGEIVRIVDTLYRASANQAQMPGQAPKVVADERMNAVIVSGDEKSRQRVVDLIRRLDAEQANTGNTKVRYLRYAKAEDLVEVLTGFADQLVSDQDAGKTSGSKRKEINIMAHVDTNALVISAEPDQMRTIESVINQLDIRRAQVLVEAIIVEVSEGDDVGFGIQWASAAGGGTQFNNLGPTIGEIGAGVWQAQGEEGTTVCTENGTCTENPDSRGDITLLAQALGKVNGMAWGVAMGDFGALIQAVSSDTKSNVLATPSITTLDNQEASFIVGDEVPILTGSQNSSNGNSNPFQTVERKEVGVKLKVVPQVNEGNAVKLTIEQEVSGINGKTGVDVTFATRRLTTTVMADSGQIVVLGGLINEEVQESVQKVPFLGDLPIIGHLFKSSSSGKKKKNLMVFIKPTIIRDGITMEGIAGRKYNYFRALQLEQQERGVNLMPKTNVPVLTEWDQEAYLPDEVNEVLNRYKEGKELETKMRETDPALKHISERKDLDNAVTEAAETEQEDDANE
ncbi:MULTISPECIES: type II secretion system secretin GspD [unclassified Shewanella]|uniref:type II secretion system secretin GspD n=1 Tax=unclassified Shewanella TaxID=196818 RepID=UPI000C818F8D|nr:MULTISPECIES: type II secretion system secretin GspD [unclassified Shewanella]MDO6619622.1 type II secretion system secretin GspD [Shewanella sp. 6_MG-2023]MDO6640577.1 type II secretion system secretin GspD [Shewanella sp. 5_MG-2023]MDO6678710.1 type II secretion system secretin GspD [Shewanella sp. 4_MG-2023]MDO6775726.1 type II secretion system secretin GspD [Shewanella sp. 3_MG-2023]PMG29115.1 type II secretion system protein GspD [Shewanella sp. 10N.286.52.C2]